MWLAVLGRILTMDNLRRRGLIAPNRCTLCYKDGESIDHIFLACSFSRKVWSRFSAALSISGPVHHIFSEVVMGWKGMHCMMDFTSVMGVLLHAFCWFIWLERNDRVFREVVRTDAQVAHRISAAVGSWLVAAELFSKEQLLCWTRCCSFQREPG
ncbi:hypothetical protein LINGRAHAP2_LOCUS15577 [Linum grandiflorum]